nr:enolase C-terminal domain-like protein [Streptomyces niphimycinicus]
MVPFFHGYPGYAAIAALDIACRDTTGSTGHSLTDLLGAAVRGTIPLTALVTRADGPAPEALAEHATRVVAEGLLPGGQAQGHRRCGRRRRQLPRAACRAAGHRAARRPQHRLVEELDLEYLEDPCPGIEGMGQVRTKVRIPLCTNMCVVRFEDFAPAVRLGAVDVVHGDVHKWGGIAPLKALTAHCETFGLGTNLHSGGEPGIATAAHPDVVASTPSLSRAGDSMYYPHADDIADPIPLIDGRLAVPQGPGLGVRVDEEKLRHYSAVNEREAI